MQDCRSTENMSRDPGLWTEDTTPLFVTELPTSTSDSKYYKTLDTYYIEKTQINQSMAFMMPIRLLQVRQGDVT